MANDLNKHECIGRIGNDIELKYLPSGEAVANLSVACNESWKDKQSGQKQERTTWIRYVAFGKLAEICGQYLAKGSQVYLCGKLRERKWQDNNGQDRYTTEIVASEMQMLGGRDQQQGGQQQQQAPQQPYQPAPKQAPQSQQAPNQHPSTQTYSQQQPAPGFNDFDDPIPF